MNNILANGHAEVAPTLKPSEKCWYLPIFGVYHPHKPNQIRAIFDSSAQFEDLSLNNVLMSGPDLTNNLLGILLRFRREHVAVITDVQQMFYGFQVTLGHRNYLHFLWYESNNPNMRLIEYRMTVHVFGNSPSPAVATYGLRRTVKNANEDVKNLVNQDFYVDDGISSFQTSSQAIDFLQRTKHVLRSNGNLTLHKIASNIKEVMNAFPKHDLAKEIKDLGLQTDSLPMQRSLGLHWDLNSDEFTFRWSIPEKPITRRTVLAMVNGLYDPLGFIAPVVLRGKLLFREATSTTFDLDEPIPEKLQLKWTAWRDSLVDLEKLKVPRIFSPVSFNRAKKTELHIFCDASETAISAGAYIKMTDENDKSHVGFALGKSKVAPLSGHSIPRLELCAAVLAVQLAEILHPTSPKLLLPRGQQSSFGLYF